VEEDMVMEFPVRKFVVFPSGVWMGLTDPTTKETLSVHNFGGIIYKTKPTHKALYKDSSFSNINANNYKQIAKQYNIPIENK
jgi:hypothetical protein